MRFIRTLRSLFTRGPFVKPGVLTGTALGASPSSAGPGAGSSYVPTYHILGF